MAQLMSLGTWKGGRWVRWATAHFPRPPKAKEGSGNIRIFWLIGRATTTTTTTAELASLSQKSLRENPLLRGSPGRFGECYYTSTSPALRSQHQAVHSRNLGKSLLRSPFLCPCHKGRLAEVQTTTRRRLRGPFSSFQR